MVLDMAVISVDEILLFAYLFGVCCKKLFSSCLITRAAFAKYTYIAHMPLSVTEMDITLMLIVVMAMVEH